MIDDMKAMGFDTLRIPVAWTNGINYESGDYTIDERLMNRVDEVVNYALDADMYVILNDHWDGSWWGMFGSGDEAVRENGMALYKSMWTQICEHFSDYSYKLIFKFETDGGVLSYLNEKEFSVKNIWFAKNGKIDFSAFENMKTLPSSKETGSKKSTAKSQKNKNYRKSDNRKKPRK